VDYRLPRNYSGCHCTTKYLLNHKQRVKIGVAEKPRNMELSLSSIVFIVFFLETITARSAVTEEKDSKLTYSLRLETIL
jgi:hypothetical protein